MASSWRADVASLSIYYQLQKKTTGCCSSLKIKNDGRKIVKIVRVCFDIFIVSSVILKDDGFSLFNSESTSLKQSNVKRKIGEN